MNVADLLANSWDVADRFVVSAWEMGFDGAFMNYGAWKYPPPDDRVDEWLEEVASRGLDPRKPLWSQLFSGSYVKLCERPPDDVLAPSPDH